MQYPTAQFGQVADSFSSLTEANMAVYAVFPSRSIDSGYRTAVQRLLKGKATMYTNTNKLGLRRGSFFQKILVDLETMQVMAVDSRGSTSVSEWVNMCKKLQDTPG